MKAGSNLEKILAGGKFAVTGELGPPKGADVAVIERKANLLKGNVDSINVTDNQTAIVRMSSIAVSAILVRMGLEPNMQMVCRDRNRIAIQSDVLGAVALGIGNILCLSGDHQTFGNHPDAKGVFDLDSTQLLHTIRLMESGKDMGGNALEGAVEFCAGAIVTPEARPIEPQMMKFEKKVEAGAQFFQTQAIYDLDNFGKFMKFARQFPVKILAGIVLLSSARMAKYMTENVPGIFVPQKLIDEMAGAPKGGALAKGIEIAGRMIAALKKGSICDGVHIMAIGKEEVVPDILAAAGL